MTWLHQTLRLCVLICAVCVGLASPSSPHPDQDAVAAALPEVRLRKLHLVRPDLIPYPVFYEVIC